MADKLLSMRPSLRKRQSRAPRHCIVVISTVAVASVSSWLPLDVAKSELFVSPWLSSGGRRECLSSQKNIRTKTVAAAESTDTKRPPWDGFRALRTAAFFGALPNPLNIFSPSPGSKKVSAGTTVWSAENPQKLVWGVLDDVVMGGASQSKLSGNMWKGTIITAGGGFAGIRTQALKPAYDVSSCTGIRLRVRGGDGQRFKLIIRDTYDWNGIAWSYEFDTKGLIPFQEAGADISAPFSEFVPTLFAKRVPNVKFNVAQLTTLQLTLSRFGYDGDLNPNFKAGDFSLAIESIETY